VGSHELRYLEPGRSRRRRLRRPTRWLLAFALIAALLASVAFFAQGSASGSVADCPYGGISAIGPVDEQGNGDTTPDVRCLEP
jgi:hypothetical protein